MEGTSVGIALNYRLAEINRKLKESSLPVSLTRLGNYKEGELEILDVLHVAKFKDFIFQVIFNVKLPFTGEIIQHQASFNHSFSAEAKSGHIIVPTADDNQSFLMMRSYGGFIGKWALVFPRGFIPLDAQDALANEIALRIFSRKLGDVFSKLAMPMPARRPALRSRSSRLSLTSCPSSPGGQCARLRWLQPWEPISKPAAASSRSCSHVRFRKRWAERAS